MVSFTVGAKSTRQSQPLLIKVGAKSTHQHDGCNICYNKRRNLYNKRLCQHADDKSSIMVWLGRRHLAFAVANCVLNLRFASALLDAAVTAGSCDGLLARPAIWWKIFFIFLIVIFSVQLQQTEISERKLFIFHLGSGVTLFLEDKFQTCIQLK